MSDDDVKIKVFASDDNLKALGELLSNDSSRNIIYNLMTKEMYTNEIATKLDMRVSLVIHHLKKLEDLGLLEISEKRIKRKGIDHRFFKIRSNIFVVLDQDKKEIEEKGFLTKVFKEGVRFALLGIGAISTWFYFELPQQEKWSGTSSPNNSFLYASIVIIIGLAIMLFFAKKRRM